VSDILSYFPSPPLDSPRGGQVSVINEAEAAIKAGYKTILIEAPVGSGKSGIALALARWSKSAHILTPMKSLQNQYHDDFNMYAVLMKGRSSYPCVFYETPADAKAIRQTIAKGELIHVERTTRNCGQGPCKDSKENYEKCTGFDGETETTPCPYTVAIETASNNDIIIHNLHSYIYQTHFGGRFGQRKMMIIDEGHRIEGILRDFAKFSVTVPGMLGSDQERARWENFEDISDWLSYFTEDRFVPKDEEEQKKYADRIMKLETMTNDFPQMWSNFSVQAEEYGNLGATKFELTPEKLGGLPQKLLYDGGEINVIMSGTIYDKNMFCRDRGINPETTYFIRIGSTFPVESRPIIMKPQYMVDTSHKGWVDNLPELVEKLKAVMAIFSDVKGLIHAPSYRAAFDLMQAMRDPRLMTHSPEDSAQRLAEFYARTDNAVYVSPTCQEGVDFKFDRARFQVILRIPYMNAGDEFISMKMKKDFPWYNYQAMITFGQQTGRINRSEKDFGVTVLMDDRFPKFIRKNKSKFPRWMLDSIKEK
jgi:Rad3-related DNA helicase